MVFQNVGDVLANSLVQVWYAVVDFLPALISALIVFFIGWLIAVSVGKLVEQVVRALKIDQFLAKLDFEKTLAHAGVELNIGGFIGALVKWFLVVVFLLTAANILGLTQVTTFLRDVLLYTPNVVVAAIILVIAALVADTLEKVVRGSMGVAGVRVSFAGVVTRWAIWIFAIIAALLQLGIAAELLQILVTGIVAMLALGFGLAFGLGGKDAAASAINKLRSEL
jgi:hypothetical protein